jgi:hypothetical protein
MASSTASNGSNNLNLGRTQTATTGKGVDDSFLTYALNFASTDLTAHVDYTCPNTCVSYFWTCLLICVMLPGYIFKFKQSQIVFPEEGSGTSAVTAGGLSVGTEDDGDTRYVRACLRACECMRMQTHIVIHI